ncbi:hypothetical protein ACFWN7_11095 [Agromyces sp. NPDC058484]|uniref:hypothetical protein n=1 Tax=Agromyces sp. NPDC058484 TaxID=3346524 RepID=UPI00364B474F
MVFSLSAVLASSVVAALLTATINILLARNKTKQEERARVRTVLAEAFAAYAQYRQYPSAIRRRNSEKPAEERVRIAELIRATQERINFYVAWTAAESESLGAAYAELITQARRVAGTAMTEAWRSPAIESDAEMVIPTSVLDLAELRPAETEYARAVAQHLAGMTRWYKL